MIEFEHTLFMLLLLTSLLNAKPPQQKWALGFIFVGSLLAFIPPVRPLAIPWNIMIGLIIPLILWQNVRRLLVAQWQIGRNELLLWGGTALTLGGALTLSHNLNWLGAVTFGLIIASLIWRASEGEETALVISQIGPLALVILFGEIEPMIAMPDYYLGSVFSGAFFGIVIALLAVYGYQRYNGRYREWITIGQIYIAYWVAAAVDVSAVMAAITSVLLFISLGLHQGFWDEQTIFSAPLNSWWGFSFLLGLFVFLGWQSHQPYASTLAIETGTGVLLAVVAAGIGRWLHIAAFNGLSLWQVGLRVSLFLLPALLLWPRGILQQPLQLVMALGIAMLVIYIASRALPEFMDNIAGENK